MKEIVLNFIIDEFGDTGEKRTNHHSYCMFPEEDCCCRALKNISYDTRLIKEGYMDSFAMVSVLNFIEKTFDIKVPYQEATPENFDTVNKIVELIKKNKK